MDARLRNNLRAGSILLMNNSFTNMASCFETEASLLSIGVRFDRTLNNGIFGLNRPDAIRGEDIKSKLSRVYTGNAMEELLFERAIISHPLIGSVQVPRLGVKLTGNFYSNLTIGKVQFLIG